MIDKKNKTRKIRKNSLKNTYILNDRQKQIICNRYSSIFKTFDHVLDGVFTLIVNDSAPSDFNLEKEINKDIKKCKSVTSSMQNINFYTYTNCEQLKNTGIKRDDSHITKINDFVISFI